MPIDDRYYNMYYAYTYARLIGSVAFPQQQVYSRGPTSPDSIERVLDVLEVGGGGLLLNSAPLYLFLIS